MGSCVRVAVGGLVVLLGLALGCSSSDSHPTVSNVITNLCAAHCQRYSDCDPSLFAYAYPHGEDQCESECRDDQDRSATDRGLNLSDATNCTTAQLDQCVADAKAVDCSQIIGNSPPCSACTASSS